MKIKQPNCIREAKTAHLENIIYRLKQGESVQVTALMPLRRLLNAEQTPLFMEYLVERTLFHIRNGTSLSVAHHPASEEKAEWFELFLALLTQYHHQERNTAFVEQAQEIEAYCESYSKGWARIWIHATRQMIDDVDLLLMHWVVRCFLNGWLAGYDAYLASRAYCTDYRNYRFIMTRQSCSRIRDILDFFGQTKW